MSDQNCRYDLTETLLYSTWALKNDKKGKSRAALEASFESYMDLFTKIDHVNYATEDAFPYGSDVRILDPSAGKGR